MVLWCRSLRSPVTFSVSCEQWFLEAGRYATSGLEKPLLVGYFFSRTFQSDQSLPRALGFILCAPCGSVVLLHAGRVFDYFEVIEIVFMDNPAQITETISRLDSEKTER